MSEHHEHLTPEAIEAILDPQDAPTADRRLAATVFLAEGCPECWKALERMRPRMDDQIASLSPIREALIRIVSSGTWPVLSADHFEAVLEVKRRPFGFVFLVAEEAAMLTTAETSLEPMAQAVGLAALLAMQHGDPALAGALARLYALRAEAHVARGEKPEAEEALVRAGGCLGRSLEEVDVTTRIRLLEAQARFAWRFDSTKKATGHYVEALKLACPRWPVRHLELMVEMVALGGWEPVDSLRRLIGALNLAAPLRSSAPHALVRAHALYRSARLLARAMKESLSGVRVPRVVEEIADELEAAEALFTVAGDRITQGLRHLCLGELRLFHAPPRSREPLRRAVESFNAAGVSWLARDARAALTKAEALTAPVN
jgi:hypothetical protein